MSEHPPQPKETPDPADKFEDIRDLIDVGEDMNDDGVNTLHRPDGKLLAVDELEMIREHQDLIRGTIDDRGENEDLPNDTDREKNRSMDADRDHIIAEHIHRLTNGKGASPEIVDKLYEMLKNGKKIDDIELPADEPPENGNDDELIDDAREDVDDALENTEDPDDNPDNPNDPENPDDTPTLVMQAPQVESRFTPEQLQKQREILDAIDDADRIFDRHKRRVALRELADKYKEVEFDGDTGTLGVEAAQRIRSSKTRSKWNPRRFWVKDRKESNYILSQMAYEKDGVYSLEAAKAMGGNVLINDKTVYPHRNKTIHRTNKWFDTEYVPGLESKITSLQSKFVNKQNDLAEKQLEAQENQQDEEKHNATLEGIQKLQVELQKIQLEIIQTQEEFNRKQNGALDALSTLRGFGGNEYFGKGIAYLAITRNEPELLYALEGLSRVKFGFKEQPVEVPLLGKVRELYHKTRINKAEAMMIPQILKESLTELEERKFRGEIDSEQFRDMKSDLVLEARAAADNLTQPDWRGEVTARVNKLI